MKILITGASSGIGHSIAKYLLNLGHDLYVVSRNKEKLEKLYKNKREYLKRLYEA